MDDEDLRDLFAGLAMFRVLGKCGSNEADAQECYAIADAMIEAKYASNIEPDEGIVAVKRKRKTKEE